MDCSQQKSFRGHDAPVLSLSFDPKEAFLVKHFAVFFLHFIVSLSRSYSFLFLKGTLMIERSPHREGNYLFHSALLIMAQQ